MNPDLKKVIDKITEMESKTSNPHDIYMLTELKIFVLLLNKENANVGMAVTEPNEIINF